MDVIDISHPLKTPVYWTLDDAVYWSVYGALHGRTTYSTQLHEILHNSVDRAMYQSLYDSEDTAAKYARPHPALEDFLTEVSGVSP